MDEWHVGDPADWGDSVGVPDIDYMGYLQGDDEDEQIPHQMTHSESLKNEAWRLRNDDRPREALAKINEALELSGSWKYYNVKAIILEDLFEYEEALFNYNQALKRTSAQIVKDNKARLLNRIAEGSTDYPKALDDINLALKITKDNDDRYEFLATKRDILECMGKHREAYACNKLANRQFDLIDLFERQCEILKNSTDTIICIAGAKFYGYSAPHAKGSIVELIKEPENDHDPDAIRVEFNQKTVGYVANSMSTLIDEASSASDIQSKFKEKTRAEIMFVFMEKHLLARLI